MSRYWCAAPKISLVNEVLVGLEWRGRIGQHWVADDAGAWLCGWEDLPSHDRHPMGEVQVNRALLRQEVGQLLVRRSLFNFQCMAGDHRSEVTVLHIYVLGAQVHGGRVGEVDRAAVVLKEGTLYHWSGASNVEPFFLHLLDEQHQRLNLSGGLAESNVFTLSAAESDLVLELRLPQDGAAKVGHDVPRSGSRRVRFLLGFLWNPVAAKVGISPHLEGVIRWMNVNTFVAGRSQISTEPLHSLAMLLSRVRTESSTLVCAHAMSGREHFSK